MTTGVFAFGSLMIPDSISAALHRRVNYTDFHPVNLTGYKRDWGATSPVYSMELGRVVNAAFLNLIEDAATTMNGLVIGVSDSEIVNLKKREKNYEIVDVAGRLDGKFTFSRILAFISDSQNETADAANTYVPLNYIQRVETACLHFGYDFLKRYRETTAPVKFPVFGGKYRFVDVDQHRFT